MNLCQNMKQKIQNFETRKVWMCGGTLELVPCSRVGHVYRRATPYTFPKGHSETVNYNTGRMVHVWMDEWSTFYHLIYQSKKKVFFKEWFLI